MSDLYGNLDSFVPDSLFASNTVPVVTEGIILAKSQGVVKRGTVIGLITASGLAKAVDSTKSDGTQVPYAILTDDVDTTGTVDVKAAAYVSGYFNKSALTFGGTDTAVTHKVALRTLGIYLK